MIPEFYTQQAEWQGRIEKIIELVGRVSALEEIAHDPVELRRTNRLMSVHSSTAIEGNQLSLSQVEDLARGDTVLAPPREVLEVENALAAFEALDSFDPLNVGDLLRAHQLLTQGVVREAGAFHTVDVDIVNANGEVIHSGSRVEKVPTLVAELLDWGRTSDDHPLIVSSAVHFLIEHIHPFRDGNGRIGRLWQTLILSRWRPIFAWTPVETLIREHQVGYYTALQASREPEIDAAAFITFMLDVIEKALAGYEVRARSIVTNVGVKIPDAILALLRDDPTLKTTDLAANLGRTKRTIERYLQTLQQSGLLNRVGSDKTGHRIVIDSSRA